MEFLAEHKEIAEHILNYLDRKKPEGRTRNQIKQTVNEQFGTSELADAIINRLEHFNYIKQTGELFSLTQNLRNSLKRLSREVTKSKRAQIIHKMSWHAIVKWVLFVLVAIATLYKIYIELYCKNGV